jgi:hypothetical protein
VSEKKYKEKHHKEQPGPSTPVGEDKRTKVPYQARYIAWKVNAAGLNQSSTSGGDSGLPSYLQLGTKVRLANDVKVWRVEVWEREKRDGSQTHLCTLWGERPDLQFIANKFEPILELPAGYGLRVPLRGRGRDGSDMTLGYVPLKGDQDDPNDSWDLCLKVYADDQLVQYDPDLELAHVWIDWPEGTILRPMLGAPGLVQADDKWLELLVATERPLPEGAEKFYLQTQLRIYLWGDEDARQAAIRKRTFKLYEDEIDFVRYAFCDIATGADEKKDPAFNLKLSRELYCDIANLAMENTEYQAAYDARYHYLIKLGTPPPAPEVKTPAEKAFKLPGLSRALPGSALTVYKVRLKLRQGPDLYDVLWVNDDDIRRADQAVTNGDEKPIWLTQDSRLRQALREAVTGAHPDARPFYGMQLFEYDGTPQDAAPRWQPTVNRLMDRPPQEKFVRAYHPVYVSEKKLLTIGHLTDIHLNARLDTLCQSPLCLLPKEAGALATPPLGQLLNNNNATFTALSGDVLKSADLLLLTGDLADYQRDCATALDAKIDERAVWRACTADALAAYPTARNWVHFYQILLGVYNASKKPVFTFLGNHDYRPNPYSIYPGKGPVHPYTSLGGDMNLTIYESIAVYGPDYQELGGMMTSSGSSKGNPANFVAALLRTDRASPRWYELAINGWRDYEIRYGEQSILCTDWDVDEDNIQVVGLSHLSRAKNYMTPTQEAIFDRWIKGEGAWKVFASHSPLACNNSAIGIGNAEARRGVKLSDIYWGGMGEAKLSDGSDGDKAAAIRKKIATELLDGPIKMVLSGHSHMDGIYELSHGRTGIGVKMVAPTPSAWGQELTFGAPDVQKRVVVTNSGGPLGEISELWGKRRSRPAGATFAFDGRTITHTHVAASSETTCPRRCVHDSENDRIPARELRIDQTRVMDGASLIPPFRGWFEYVKDRDDPSLNTVARLGLVACDENGVWSPPEVSRVTCVSTVSRDTNVVFAGVRKPVLVDFMRMEFALSSKILEAAERSSLAGPGRAYVVLQYNDKREDDWVIEVTAFREDRDLAPTSRGEAVKHVAYKLAMVEFPLFEDTSRFKTR